MQPIITCTNLVFFYSHQEPEDENTEHEVPCVGLPRLIAYRPEPKQAPRVEKVPSTGLSAVSLYCPQCLEMTVMAFFIFPTVIAASRGYNIRGGEVIVSLFFAALQVPEVESKQDALLAQCDYCQQLCQPFIHSELLENETDSERVSVVCLPQTRN